ncbi:hypothetical protein, partial [Streptococcus sobrinus]|uniref:hypothetical protein n=1 Tax=Streptococcus sobrinus TaxID=1310 RepID=UPI0005164EBB
SIEKCSGLNFQVFLLIKNISITSFLLIISSDSFLHELRIAKKDKLNNGEGEHGRGTTSI